MKQKNNAGINMDGCDKNFFEKQIRVVEFICDFICEKKLFLKLDLIKINFFPVIIIFK